VKNPNYKVAFNLKPSRPAARGNNRHRSRRAGTLPRHPLPLRRLGSAHIQSSFFLFFKYTC